MNVQVIFLHELKCKDCTCNIYYMNYKILNIEKIIIILKEYSMYTLIGIDRLYKNDALVQFNVILIYFHLITNNLI